MDKARVGQLMEKMRAEPDFRNRVLAIEDINDRMALIKSEGFDCKIEDVQLYMHHFSRGDGEEVVVLTEKGGCNGIWYGFCF